MSAYSFEILKTEYARLLSKMIVARDAGAHSAADRIIAGRGRYKAVEAATGVPWRFVAVLHNRESSADFRGVLHNGERIIGTGRRTALVPKGRGPFASWEDSAVDVLKFKGFDKISDWSSERMCFCAESFNGWGYRNRRVPSPYLWSGSNHYVKGKYVADGKYDAGVVDRQLGCMVLYEYLRKIDVEPYVPPTDSAKSEGLVLQSSVWRIESLIEKISHIFRRR